MPASNSFGTFLETRELMQKGARDKRRATPTADSSAQAAASLRMLTEHDFPTPLHELLKSSDMPWDAFVQAVDGLREAGLVEVQQETDGEVVMLTERGREFRAAT